MATNIQSNNYNYQYSNMPQRKGVKDFSLASLIGDEIPNIKEPEFHYHNNNNNNYNNNISNNINTNINTNINNINNNINNNISNNINNNNNNNTNNINNNNTNNLLVFQNNLTALQNKFNSNNNINTNVNSNDYENNNNINKKLLLISMILDKSFEIKDNNYLSILDKFCNVNNNPLLPFSDGNYDYKKKITINNILKNNKSEIKNILNNSETEYEKAKLKVEDKKDPMNNSSEFSPKPDVKYSKLKRNRPTKFTIGNIPFKNDCYCSICNKVFNRKYDLRRHVRLHTNNTPYKCKACGQGFARSDYLKNHIRNTISCLQSEHYKEKFSK